MGRCWASHDWTCHGLSIKSMCRSKLADGASVLAEAQQALGLSHVQEAYQVCPMQDWQGLAKVQFIAVPMG